ncbi:estradiol 17-beta-dehydrogenase 2-like isoform X2 [Rhipicephalus sanguineus]|uniref:estradiol 17-beta-dehydrogenase 2-like isoform X2 n=1 Tax=Rhipicephalus sanguineus TaxID=34632 RepID=UPI0020C256BF|nr:estradiol 17-beta-dehydrogenase 2-like isoform X2 [Rhipicephalus sanguineus]
MRTRWILFFVLILPLWEAWKRWHFLTQCATYFGSTCLVLLASFWLAQLIWSNVFTKFVEGGGKAVLVTGCDTGFGNLLAKRLASEKFFVYAGCLNASGDGARELSMNSNIRVLQMDVTNEDQMEEALVTVKGTLESKVLWAVVANAGVPSHGLLEWESMQSIRKVFDVNVFGVVRVSKIFLPLLRRSKGRLVVVGSVLDGLRRECLGKGVDVCTIEPTAYRTRIVADVGSLNRIQDDLSRLPREVLDDYGELEILDWMKTAEILFKWMAREDPNEVVQQMVRAVRESEPRPYYAAWGPLDPAIYFVLREAPAEFVDALSFVVRKISAWSK